MKAVIKLVSYRANHLDITPGICLLVINNSIPYIVEVFEIPKSKTKPKGG